MSTNDNDDDDNDNDNDDNDDYDDDDDITKAHSLAHGRFSLLAPLIRVLGIRLHDQE